MISLVSLSVSMAWNVALSAFSLIWEYQGQFKGNQRWHNYVLRSWTSLLEKPALLYNLEWPTAEARRPCPNLGEHEERVDQWKIPFGVDAVRRRHTIWAAVFIRRDTCRIVRKVGK